MSRFLSNDFINKDPRAKLTVAKMANIGALVTPSAEYLTASGLTSLTVTAGCVVTVGSTGVFKTDATVLSTGNLDAGSAFVVGKDYYVYICDPGSEDLDEVYKISLNSTYPDGYNAETSRKIGGFHYGRVRQVSSKLKHIRATIKAYRSGKITKEKLLMKYASWEGHAKHADTYRLRMKIKGQIEAEIKKKELIGNGSITPDN